MISIHRDLIHPAWHEALFEHFLFGQINCKIYTFLIYLCLFIGNSSCAEITSFTMKFYVSFKSTLKILKMFTLAILFKNKCYSMYGSLKSQIYLLTIFFIVWNFITAFTL